MGQTTTITDGKNSKTIKINILPKIILDFQTIYLSLSKHGGLSFGMPKE